jgi:hypothetical protein
MHLQYRKTEAISGESRRLILGNVRAKVSCSVACAVIPTANRCGYLHIETFRGTSTATTLIDKGSSRPDQLDEAGNSALSP